VGVRRRLGAVGGADFREDVAHVTYHGVLADHQLIRDLRVALAGSHMAEHFDLAT
jgi:hypothetical protein